MFQTATGPGRLSPMAHLQMVAAVQPFLSGGVSKTVPVPADIGVQEIEDVFIAAWRLGLKSIAAYCEGSSRPAALRRRGLTRTPSATMRTNPGPLCGRLRMPHRPAAATMLVWCSWTVAMLGASWPPN